VKTNELSGLGTDVPGSSNRFKSGFKSQPRPIQSPESQVLSNKSY